MQKTRTTVKIAGKDYTIASYDGEEYVQRVAAFVNRRMSDLQQATRLPTAQLAVLAAVSVADDMMKAHDELTRLRAELDETRADLEALKRAKERT